MKELVNIKLDKTRHIFFGLRAQKMTEKMLGIKSFLGYMNTTKGEIGANEMSTILYAGLLWEDNDITLDSVIDLVDEHSNIITVIEAIGKAIQIAMSNDKEEKPEKNV